MRTVTAHRETMEVNLQKMKPLAVSVPEAARMVSLSRSTMFEMVRKGTVRSRMIGGRRVVLMRSLEELVGETGDAPEGKAA